MAKNFIRRIVNLEDTDYWAVKRCAHERGLGGTSFSAALRMSVKSPAFPLSRYFILCHQTIMSIEYQP